MNCVVVLWFLFSNESGHHESFDEFKQYHWDLSHIGNKMYPIVLDSYEKKDWHDYEFMKYEATREGPGEQGKSYELTDPKDIEEDKRLEDSEGLKVFVSDRISVNRSIWDTRPVE